MFLRRAYADTCARHSTAAATSTRRWPQQPAAPLAVPRPTRIAQPSDALACLGMRRALSARGADLPDVISVLFGYHSFGKKVDCTVHCRRLGQLCLVQRQWLQ